MATQIQSEVLAELPTVGLPGKHPERSARTPKPRKKLIRRAEQDYSQLVRRSYQLGFLLLNVWIGGLFYIWVRHFEVGTQSSMTRPAGVEGWLPIAGMMNTKYWLQTGHIPAIHPAAMFLLLTFLAIAFLFRKAFCSWLCPVGTISEYLWRAGRKIFHRNFSAPRWLDIPLRGLKYLLLGFFVWAVFTMSAEAIGNFMASDYGLVADVKMLNFFRYLGGTAAVVLAILAVASLFVQNFWCRYLCPYGALLGLASFPSPLRIRREEEACIDCAKCAKACPSSLPVDKLVTIKSAECTGCLECVAVCPAEGALQMSAAFMWGRTSLSAADSQGRQARNHPKVPAWVMAAGIAALFFGIVGVARTVGHWKSDIPYSVYRTVVPRASEAHHPMPGDPGMN
jgi:polyferredoxin